MCYSFPHTHHISRRNVRKKSLKIKLLASESIQVNRAPMLLTELIINDNDWHVSQKCVERTKKRTKSLSQKNEARGDDRIKPTNMQRIKCRPPKSTHREGVRCDGEKK